MDKGFGKRFTDWQPLQQGGQAKLYRVYDTWTGKVCALKVGTDSPESRTSLLHEFRLLSRLRHPCLVKSLDLVWDRSETAGTVQTPPVHDAARTGAWEPAHLRPAHLMEYVPLVPPDQLWREGGEKAVQAAIIQAWRGLHYLHRQGLVHGDVSPGNILVWRDGTDWRAKVADLGLVQAEEVAVLTKGVRGTVDYLAPEVLRGEGGSLAADLFGLAATAVHWIDGESYFARLDPATAMRRMAEFEGGLEAGRPVSEALARAIEGWSNGDPTRRLALATESVRQVMTNVEAHGEDSAKGGFGPEVGAATIHGLKEVVPTWLGAILNEGASLLVVKGRVGSGRRTALRQVARELAVEGWVDLGDVPAEVGRYWVRSRGARMDAVELSRAMLEHFAGNRVVLRWPARLSEMEERVLRAFVAGREGNTVVLVAGPVEGDVPGELWLRTHLRVHDEVWVGPEDEAMRKIAADLHCSEGKGTPDDGATIDIDGASPLSLEVMKMGGRGGDDDELRAEAEAIWERVCLGCRRGLLLCGWSERGYEAGSLEDMIGQEGALELEGLLCIRSDFGAGERRLVFTDALIKAAMCDVIDEAADQTLFVDLGRMLLLGEQSVELSIATQFLRKGVFLEAASLEALKNALGTGDYTAILDYKEAMTSRLDGTDSDAVGRTTPMPEALPGAGRQKSTRMEDFSHWDKRFVDFFWEAARNIGRLPEEAELLRKQLRFGENEATHRRLVEVLCALGWWGEAQDECALLPPSDWVQLKRIQIMWEMGNHDLAEEEYNRIERRWKTLSKQNVVGYCVGRARLEFRRRCNEQQWKWLLAAKERAGVHCEKDSIFLNQMAIAMKAKGDMQSSADFLHRSAKYAAAQHNWNRLVRAKLNLNTIAESMGRLNDARRHIEESHSAAIACGSDLLEGQAETLGGFVSALMGRPGKSRRVAEWTAKLARELGASSLKQLNHQLFAVLDTYYGISNSPHLDELSIGERLPLDVLELNLRLDFDSSLRHISASKKTLDELTLDERISCQKLSAESHLMLKTDTAKDELERAYRLDSKYGEVKPGLKIVEWFCLNSIENKKVLGALNLLLNNSRVYDAIYWGYYLVLGLDRFKELDRLEIRRSLVKALSEVSRDFDKKQFRETFFGLRRIRESLIGLNS